MTAPVTDEELNAYLDGELSVERRPAVEDYLRHHPHDAHRLKQYKADGEALARIFSQAGPAAAAIERPRNTFSARRWRSAAIILLFAGAAIAAALWHTSRDDGLRAFGQYAAIVLDRMRSQNISPTDPNVQLSLAQASELLSKARGTKIELRDPAAAGYRLVRSERVAGSKGDALLLAFAAPDGRIVTMYLEGRPGARDTPFQPVQTAHGSTLIWYDNELACAISADLAPSDLEAVGHRLYDAMIS